MRHIGLAICAAALLLAAPAVAGDRPDAAGCYTLRLFEPFVTGITCPPGPALGDPTPSAPTPSRVGVVREPEHCPYGEKPEKSREPTQ